MLRQVKEMHGAVLEANDGQIGSVDEILFDDEQWTVRYLVADTGNWLTGHKVLIAPVALGILEWDRQVLNVNLTRAQVEQSPGVETDEPVSRQWEADYYDYYALPYYWGGMGLVGTAWYPGTLFDGVIPATNATDVSPADAHLRSTKEVTGYGIIAQDGPLGHAEGFIVDDETWRIRYLAVDTHASWPGKKVLLPPEWIVHANWPDRTVTVGVTRDQMRNGPRWDPRQPISRAFEEESARYYALQHQGVAERLAARR